MNSVILLRNFFGLKSGCGIKIFHAVSGNSSEIARVHNFTTRMPKLRTKIRDLVVSLSNHRATGNKTENEQPLRPNIIQEQKDKLLTDVKINLLHIMLPSRSTFSRLIQKQFNPTGVRKLSAYSEKWLNPRHFKEEGNSKTVGAQTKKLCSKLYKPSKSHLKPNKC